MSSRVHTQSTKEIGDNALALGIVVFSGLLTLFALHEGVNEDRARAAIAAGASGISGVIGFIGGKARRHQLDNQEESDNNEVVTRLAYLEEELGVKQNLE